MLESSFISWKRTIPSLFYFVFRQLASETLVLCALCDIANDDDEEDMFPTSVFPTPVPGSIEMTLVILIPTAAVGLIIGKAGQFLKVRFASLEQGSA